MTVQRDDTTKVRYDRPDRPCPVCSGHSRGCSETTDGAVRCRIGPVNPTAWRCVYIPPADGFGLYRPLDPRAMPATTPPAPASLTSPKPTKAIDWTNRAATYMGRMSAAYARRLADHLELPVECIAALDVGFISHGPEGTTYSFPEYDGAGVVTGIGTRLVPHGHGPAVKRCQIGSRRGLTLPLGWHERATARGVLFLVEGPTDVLAMSHVGLPAVGRPSNAGGVKELVVLLTGLPTGTGVVFVGERDRKEDGRWPGLDGPKVAADVLAGLLGRPVRVTLPPPGHKDSRDYLAARLLAGETGAVEVGQEYERLLLASAEGWHAHPPAVAPHAASDADAAYPFDLIPSDEFASGDYRPEWLIQNVLVRGEPGTVAGPSKALKTSLLVDAAVSLAAGVPFLGDPKFSAPHPRRVVMASGESGKSTLQDAARRVSRSKGLELQSLGKSLHWLFTLPVLSDVRSVRALAARLAGVQADVVLIDPFYLCLGEADARNLMEVGNVLRPVAEILAKAGTTLVLAHHANRQLPVGQPMELTHLMFSGLEQFTRQFLLINRRSFYRSDGRHELVMRVGGSAGHSGLYHLDVDEGVMNAQFGGRHWTPVVREASEAAAQAATERETKAGDKAVAKMHHSQAKVLNAIDGIVTPGVLAASMNAICETGRMGRTTVREAIDGLIEAGKLVEQKVEVRSGKGGKTVSKCRGWRRPDSDGVIDDDPLTGQRVNPAVQPVIPFDPPD